MADDSLSSCGGTCAHPRSLLEMFGFFSHCASLLEASIPGLVHVIVAFCHIVSLFLFDNDFLSSCLCGGIDF